MTEPGREKETGVAATVTGELPNATWKVELEDRRQVLVHAAGAQAAVVFNSGMAAIMTASDVCSA